MIATIAIDVRKLNSAFFELFDSSFTDCDATNCGATNCGATDCGATDSSESVISSKYSSLIVKQVYSV